LVVRDLVVVGTRRELDMKTEFRIDIFIDVQTQPVAPANILHWSGNGIARSGLNVGAKPKISAEFEAAKAGRKGIDFFGEFFNGWCWRLGLDNCSCGGWCRCRQRWLYGRAQFFDLSLL